MARYELEYKTNKEHEYIKLVNDFYKRQEVNKKKEVEESREEAKREDARNLKQLNVDDNIISKATGLSAEEIEKLK